jgi:hypothetical protein
MPRSKLAEEIKRLLPNEKEKRIRQAIMKAYGGAAAVAVGVKNTISQENRLRNGTLVEGIINFTSPTSASLSGWAWVIDYQIQEGSDQTIAITAPNDSFSRVDYFHGDDEGVIHYAPGILDEDGNSIFPTIPDGNIILKKILRNTDGTNLEQTAEQDQEKWLNLLETHNHDTRYYKKSEVKEITGFRNALNTQNQQNLVAAINESNTWTQIEW